MTDGQIVALLQGLAEAETHPIPTPEKCERLRRDSVLPKQQAEVDDWVTRKGGSVETASTPGYKGGKATDVEYYIVPTKALFRS
jgi:hypothetical protein